MPEKGQKAILLKIRNKAMEKKCHSFKIQPREAQNTHWVNHLMHNTRPMFVCLWPQGQCLSVSDHKANVCLSVTTRPVFVCLWLQGQCLYVCDYKANVCDHKASVCDYKANVCLSVTTRPMFVCLWLQGQCLYVCDYKANVCDHKASVCLWLQGQCLSVCDYKANVGLSVAVYNVLVQLIVSMSACLYVCLHLSVCVPFSVHMQKLYVYTCICPLFIVRIRCTMFCCCVIFVKVNKTLFFKQDWRAEWGCCCTHDWTSVWWLDVETCLTSNCIQRGSGGNRDPRRWGKEETVPSATLSLPDCLLCQVVSDESCF